jgi:hypothetical protein
MYCGIYASWWAATANQTRQPLLGNSFVNTQQYQSYPKATFALNNGRTVQNAVHSEILEADTFAPDGVLTPGQTGRLTIGHKITLTLDGVSPKPKTNPQCGQHVDFFYITVVGTYSYHWNVEMIIIGEQFKWVTFRAHWDESKYKNVLRNLPLPVPTQRSFYYAYCWVWPPL